MCYYLVGLLILKFHCRNRRILSLLDMYDCSIDKIMLSNNFIYVLCIYFCYM